ncbi:MAG: DUF4157 domain-containing protein [bacterium]
MRAPDGSETLASLEHDLGPGAALDGATASRMTGALGADLGAVRIHTGPVAAAKAAAVDAVAFAVGPNIVMGARAPAAGTVEGDALLAHELAHTVQQADAARDPVARLQPIGAESGAAEDHADDVAAEAAVALHGGDKAAKPSLLQRLGGWFSSTVRLQRCSGGVDPTYQATKAVGPDVGRVVGVSNPSGGVWFNQRTLTAGATVGAAPDEAQAVALAKTLHRDIAVIPADGQYFLYAIVGAGDLDLDLVYGRNAGIRMEAGVAALVHHRGLTYYARDLAATTEPARPQQTGSLAALDAYQALNQERGGIDALSEPELIATFEAAMFDTALAVLSASEGQAQLKATQFKQPGATSADEHATIETTGQELVTVQTELERVTADVEMMRHPPIDDVIHTAPPGWADGLPEAEAAMARLRAEKRRLLQRYPMLGRYRSASALRSFLAGGPKEREAALAGDADAVLRDISTTRHHVLAGDLNLWGMQPVVEATVAGLGIGADSPQRARIASKAKAQRKQEAFYNVALGVFSLGFGLAAAFTSGGLSLALTAGAAGLGAYDAITTTEDFFAQNAATNTDVDPDAALLPAEARMHWGWLVVAWAGVALDFADVLKAATIAGEVEHVARGAKSIEEAAEALAKGDRKLLDRLRRAAGDTALTDTISEAIRPGLANRIGAEIIVDANLGQDVRVLYELKAAGATRVAHVKVGPGAKVADVLAHTDTIRMLNRYEGAAGKARQQWDRLRSFAGMGKAGQVPFEAGSKAFDSWHELEKLQQLIGYRRGLLAEMLEKAPSATEAQVALRTELDFLENEVDIHRRVVDAVVLERGTGAIAMSSSTRDALAAGHQLPEFPGKAAADLTADDLKSSAHYFRREADGTFTLQQKATKAPKAAPRALDAVELGPPHASWDPALGEALEIQLRRVTANNKQHRVATSIQQLARSPHGAELARRLLDPRIKAAQGYDGIVQRLLSIDEPKQADLIAELVDAEHLIETGDMTKQTLSLGETSSGTRRGDPGHYDIDSALVNADGTIETAVQTYRPRTSSLQAILRGIVEKANKQLASFPAKKKILAVHVDNLAFVSLGSEGTTLQRFARESGAEVHIVPESGGRIVFYPSGTVK